MPRFLHGPIEIDYLDEGDGDPIVLVHGIASTKEVNWVLPGWVSTLVKAGRRVIALDNRGHGQTTKLYEPADYHTDKMVEDVCGLLDHLALPPTRWVIRWERGLARLWHTAPPACALPFLAALAFGWSTAR